MEPSSWFGDILLRFGTLEPSPWQRLTLIFRCSSSACKVFIPGNLINRPQMAIPGPITSYKEFDTCALIN